MLAMHTSSAARRRMPTQPLLATSLTPQAGLRRAETEAFIRAAYARAHGATVTRFMPELLALRDAEGNVLAACGLRVAAGSRLFLEAYLDAPVETVLEQRIGLSVPRAGIVEVGNLAVSGSGSARTLIRALTDCLHARGPDWVVFTAVPTLHNAFLRLGIAPLPLARAHAERLPEGERAAWGRYYEANPQVMAVSVHAAHEALNPCGARVCA